MKSVEMILNEPAEQNSSHVFVSPKQQHFSLLVLPAHHHNDFEIKHSIYNSIQTLNFDSRGFTNI